MATITQISRELQTLLGPVADQVGTECGFIQRVRVLSGSSFVQALVFGVMVSPELTYTNLCQGAAHAGVLITPQGMEQRFTEKSAEFLRGMVERAIEQKMSGETGVIPLLNRFGGVHMRDSSQVILPNALKDIWPGVGGSCGKTASVKLQVGLEYSRGQLKGPVLQAGREGDGHSPFQDEPLSPGEVRMGDLGFYSLEQMAADHQQGVYWISYLKAGTVVCHGEGQRLDLLAWLRSLPAAQVDLPIQLGAKTRIPARLIARRVPQEVADQRRRKLKEYARKKQVAVSPERAALAEWTLIVTNIPAELLSIHEAQVLLAVRWQIELLFRLWKSQFRIDQWRSQNPWRILTELYAKLLLVVLLHWVFLIRFWSLPNHSLWKAAQTVRQYAALFAPALKDRTLLEALLERIQAVIAKFCLLNSRSTNPNTYQRLMPEMYPP